MRASVFSFCIFLFSFSALVAQQHEEKRNVSFTDTVFMMNGDILPAHITDTTFFGVKLLKPSKKGPKEVVIEGELIYSLRFADGHEKVLYSQDSMRGNEFSSAEAKLYIIGQRDAEKGYRSRFSTTTGFFIGGASAFLSPNILAPLPCFAWSSIMLIPKIRIRHRSVSNENYLQYNAYLQGYEKNARTRRAVRSFFGGVAGLAAGFIAGAIVK